MLAEVGSRLKPNGAIAAATLPVTTTPVASLQRQPFTTTRQNGAIAAATLPVTTTPVASLQRQPFTTTRTTRKHNTSYPLP
jgi:hypothetical protein